MSRFRLLLLAGALACFGLLALACGGDDDTANPSPTTAASKPTGSITVYSGRSESLVQSVIDQFQKDSGIQVNVKYGDTAALAALIVEEGGRSPADVYFGQDAGALGALTKAGLLSPLPSAVTGKVPAQYRAKDGTWVGISGRSRAIVYNPDAVQLSALPASYKDLTRPEWKGKVGWAPTNASFQSFVTAIRKIDGEAAAKKWLEDMKANDAKTYAGNAPIVTAAASGEISLGLVNHYYLYAALAENPNLKAKNHFTAPNDPASLVNVAGAAVLKSSKNPDAARAFIEYLLAESAQKYFAEKTFEYPLVSGVAIDSRLKPLAELKPPSLDLSDLNDLQGTLALLKSTGVIQ